MCDVGYKNYKLNWTQNTYKQIIIGSNVLLYFTIRQVCIKYNHNTEMLVMTIMNLEFYCTRTPTSYQENQNGKCAKCTNHSLRKLFAHYKVSSYYL